MELAGFMGIAASLGRSQGISDAMESRDPYKCSSRGLLQLRKSRGEQNRRRGGPEESNAEPLMSPVPLDTETGRRHPRHLPLCF